MFQLARALFIAFAIGSAVLGFLLFQKPLVFSSDVLHWLAGLLVVFSVLESLAWYLRRRHMSRTIDGFTPTTINTFFLQLAATATIGVAVIALVGALIYAGRGFLGLVENPASRIYAFPGIAACLVFALGLALFIFRRLLRVTYGAVEVVVGMVVAVMQSADVVSAGHPIDGRFVLALATAGVYLVVRGLDNMEQGLKSTPNDVGARLVRRFIVPKRTVVPRDLTGQVPK